MKSPPIHRTPLYRAKAAYRNMQRRCLNADGNNPAYKNVELRMTLREWLEWALPKYESFIKENPKDKPSVARHNDEGHYELGNLSICSLSENIKQQKRKHTWVHGTLSGYRYCRCALCSKAKRKYMQEYKRKTEYRGFESLCSHHLWAGSVIGSTTRFIISNARLAVSAGSIPARPTNVKSNIN